MGFNARFIVVHGVVLFVFLATIFAALVKLTPVIDPITHKLLVWKFEAEYYPVWQFINIGHDDLRKGISFIEIACALGTIKKFSRIISYSVLIILYSGALYTHYILKDYNWKPAAALWASSVFCLYHVIQSRRNSKTSSTDKTK